VLPLARIKKIMKIEEFILTELEKDRQQKVLMTGEETAIDGRENSRGGRQVAVTSNETNIKFMISSEAPLVMTKACELLVQEISLRAWRHTEANRRRTLQRADVHAAVCESETFDFLIDIVPRIPTSSNINQTALPTFPPAIPPMSVASPHQMHTPSAAHPSTTTTDTVPPIDAGGITVPLNMIVVPTQEPAGMLTCNPTYMLMTSPMMPFQTHQYPNLLIDPTQQLQEPVTQLVQQLVPHQTAHFPNTTEVQEVQHSPLHLVQPKIPPDQMNIQQAAHTSQQIQEQVLIASLVQPPHNNERTHSISSTFIQDQLHLLQQQYKSIDGTVCRNVIDATQDVVVDPYFQRPNETNDNIDVPTDTPGDSALQYFVQ
jgi:histone H3/H4